MGPIALPCLYNLLVLDLNLRGGALLFFGLALIGGSVMCHRSCIQGGALRITALVPTHGALQQGRVRLSRVLGHLQLLQLCSLILHENSVR